MVGRRLDKPSGHRGGNGGEFSAAGFTVVSVLDKTEAARASFARMRERIAREGPPRLGVHILMGDSGRAKGRNSARNIEEGRTRPIEFLCRKPG